MAIINGNDYVCVRTGRKTSRAFWIGKKELDLNIIQIPKRFRGKRISFKVVESE